MMIYTLASDPNVFEASVTISLSTRSFSQPASSTHEHISTSRTLDSTMVSSVQSLILVLSIANFASAARRFLDLYSPKVPCFNDDVQGTGCVTLAAIMSGLHVSQQKLSDMRVVIFGSGSAGCGIADQIRDAIATERKISKEDAAKQLW